MKRLKITNDHGWTPRTLRKQDAWPCAISDGRTTTRNQTTRVNYHTCGCWLGHRFIMEHAHFTISHPTYGVSMSRGGIRKLLHRLRLSWTRPTYKLVKGDAKRQAAFQKELEFIKKKLITENVTECHAVLCG